MTFFCSTFICFLCIFSINQMANLGESDHNLVFVRPKYLPIIQHIKPKTVLVENWTAEAMSS